MINKSKGNIAYNIIDIDGEISNDIVKKISSAEGILGVRVI
jgi:D-3-phosphoglycerate dehydrogenase